MRIFLLISNYVSLFLLFAGIWMEGAGGGLMDKKWEMMKWMMDKHSEHHGGKTLSFSLKPIALPIPLPVPIPVAMKEKGDTKPAKPWKAESKDMFWKMMMMKMVMDKGDKKGGKGMCCPQMMMTSGWPMMQKGGGDKGGSKMCCPQSMMQMNGWPMMQKGGGMKGGSMMCCPQSMMQMNGWPMMMKASPMMCCPKMMMMMNGGSKGCNMMMNGGWPPPMGCQMNGGGMWPEEEEEEYPDYYEEEEQMSGWDTENLPVQRYPGQSTFMDKLKRKGDAVTQSKSRRGNNNRPYVRESRLRSFFRKGTGNLRNDFENDFN